MAIDPRKWTREELERHSVDMRQFIDFRQSTLANGMRIIEAYNSSGLTFTLLPDRGMDIWTAHYKGIPLTWISQGSPHPPDFGQTWLQQFNGGLLTTCGLTHVGPPEKDHVTGEWRDVHGRYSRLRANAIRVEPTWSTGATGINYEVDLIGYLHEGVLFGEQLRVSRDYRMELGQPSVEIFTNVQNIGDKPAPLMLLHHFNLGFPLISDGTEMLSAHEAVYPRDEAARSGFESWARYEAASPGYPEQVFYHFPKGNDGGAYLEAQAMIQHQDLGLLVRWDAKNQPYLTQWKNTRQGVYVCGIEPGNCIPEGQNAARRNARLVMIEPGETQVFSCHLIVLDGAERIERQRKSIEMLQDSGNPVPNCRLDDYAKFARES